MSRQRITSRPCCDNCPFYDPKAKVLDLLGGWTWYGLSYDTRTTNLLTGACTYLSTHLAHRRPEDRCANHPWIARWHQDFYSDLHVSIADDWRHYCNELPFFLDVIAGGDDGAVLEDDPMPTNDPTKEDAATFSQRLFDWYARHPEHTGHSSNPQKEDDNA